MEKGETSPKVQKYVNAITKMAARKSGVTRAEALEKLSISPVQWNRARKKAGLKVKGKARAAVYFTK